MSVGTKIVRRGGKVYTYPRDYISEYKERTPEQKDNRSIRRRARKKLENKYGEKSLQGKDVDHKKGIGGGNGSKNLRIQSPKANRSRKSLKWR